MTAIFAYIQDGENTMNTRKGTLYHRLVMYLNDKSLIVKFSTIFILGMLIPVLLSCAIFSHNLNKNFYEREMDNLVSMTSGKVENLNSMFDDAVVVSNIIANDSIVRNLADIQFEGPLDYYDYIIDNDFKDYFQTYIEQKTIIGDAIAYIDNDTIVNGGIVWKIDDEIKKNDWYKTAEKSDRNVILCREGQSGNADRLCIIRKLGRGKTETVKIGYIRISVNTNELREQMLSDIDYMSFYLANDKQNLLYDPIRNHLVQIMGNEQSITETEENIIVEKCLGKNSYLEDWRVIGVYNRSRIVQKQLENIGFVIMINILISLLMTFVIYTVYRSYNERISKLQLSMREMENEIFNEIEGEYGSDEIGKLTDSYNRMVNKINILINDNYKLELENKNMELEKIRTELNALQSQINPHFIFNVLNAMLIFSVKNGYAEIVPQISGLAKMIRRLLDWKEDFEPFSKEIDFLEIYLQLEKFRFGDIFNYDIVIGAGVRECNIPKMIIQPIVENACKHGLHSISHERYLKVSAELNDDVLTVCVKDNGIGISQEKLDEILNEQNDEKFNGHIGIKNVYRRLKLFCGEKSDLKIVSSEGKGTEVIITIDYN